MPHPSTCTSQPSEGIILPNHSWPPVRHGNTSKCHAHSRPYSAYKFNAVVDWVELRIVTSRASNHDTVTKRTGASYAKPLEDGPGQAATAFLVRFQDPKSWEQIEAALLKFTHDHPLTEPITVTGIEVAFDTYSKSQNRDELVAMTYQLYKFATHFVSDKRRMNRGKDDLYFLDVDCVRPWHLNAGYTINVGHRSAEETQRLYLKCFTVLDGKVVPLPEKEHRARLEITLRSDRLPVRSMEDLKTFDFTDLAPFFKFRRLKPKLNPFVRAVVEHVDQIGEARERKTKHGKTRKFSVSTVADKELNDNSYSALRELTKRMQKGASLT